MASDRKLFTFEEVSKHSDNKDIWLIIHGKVYDVTSFLDDHPGGEEVLLTAVEKDATDDFEDVGHSDSAREMMEKYYVGEVDISTLPKKNDYKKSSSSQATPEQNQGSEIWIKILQILVPLLILGVAFGLQYFGKKH